MATSIDWHTATTPGELLGAELGSSQTVLKIEQRLDGFMALGSSLDFIKPTREIEFKKELIIKSKSFANFKGITELSMFPQIQEISLGFTQNFEFFLLLCPATSEKLKYKDIVIEVQNAIEGAIHQLHNSSTTSRRYYSKEMVVRKINTSDWEEYSIHLNEKLTSSFVNPETFVLDGIDGNTMYKHVRVNRSVSQFYFLVRRMGQDKILIPPLHADVLEEFEYWKTIGIKFKEINVKSNSLLSVAVHNAFDLFPTKGKFPMWDMKSIEEMFKAEQDEPTKYFPFHIPGVGNIVYNFTSYKSHVSKCPIKFLQFYTRHAHQYHRNDSPCFKEVHFVSALAYAQALILRKDFAKEGEKTIKKLEKMRNAVSIVNPLINQLDFPKAARCEVVTEHRARTRSDKNEKTASRMDIDEILYCAYKDAKYFFQKRKLESATNLVFLPIDTLKLWLKNTLLPCQQTLMSSITPMIKMLNQYMPTNGETRSKLVDLAEVSSNNLNGPDDYLNVLVAEALITLFVRGELSSKWPIYLLRTLELNKVKFSNRGEPCAIKYVQFSDKIRCKDLPSINISFHLPIWIGKSSLDECKVLLTLFEELKSITHKDNKDTRMGVLKSLAQEYFQMMCTFISEGNCDKESNKISLHAMADFMYNKYSSAHKNKLITVKDFVDHLKKSQIKTLSEVFSVLLCSMCTTVKTKLRREIFVFEDILVQEISEMILELKYPLYFPLNNTSLAAILPSTHYTDNMVNVYVEAFERCIGRKNGLRGISCSQVFEETLPLAMEEKIFEDTKSKFYIPIRNFFDAVVSCLDNSDRCEIEKSVTRYTLSPSVLDAFCNIKIL